MKKLKVMAAVAAAVAIFGANAIGEDRVAGESLDSGLGELSASYTGAEFVPAAKAELVFGDVNEDLANWRCSTCS